MAKPNKSDHAKRDDRFRFRRLDNVGNLAAEEDDKFLGDCFVDVGHIRVLRDCNDGRRIVVGRTGAGKSALLKRIEVNADRTIVITPEDLALAHISNTLILKCLNALGVRLDVFFKMLWRHVLCAEILRKHYKIDDQIAKNVLLDRIGNLFRGKSKAAALDYLRDYGDSFWKETHERIKETTDKIESELKGALATSGTAALTLDAVRRLSHEQKQDIIQRTEPVLDNERIRKLSAVMDLLNECLTDPQKRYYILIDRLDENWVEDEVKYRLIRALIETAKDFHRVRHVKVVLALRLDLIERVFEQTRDPGFQQEKYESLYLSIDWPRDRLVEVLDRRVSHLVKQRYTKAPVSASDVLPESVGGEPALEYMLNRTMQRPRDLIQFFNECVVLAADSPMITAEMIRQAEGSYSRKRLVSLGDEWFADYPNLVRFSDLLKGRSERFPLSDVTKEQCIEFCLQAGVLEMSGDDLAGAARDFLEDENRYIDFLKTVFRAFHRVGMVGLKLESFERVSWSSDGQRHIGQHEIDLSTKVSVHKAVWRVLGIVPLK